MESLVIKMAARVLRHRGICFAFVGEIALNYYNVPRVRHDIEICVPHGTLQEAADAFLSTGLFQSADWSAFDLYTKYKRNMPRLSTTGWIMPRQTVTLFPDSAFYLDPLDKSLVAWEPGQPCHISSHILDTDGIQDDDIHAMSFPRLHPLLVGYARRYIDEQDDSSMIAAEQLVDGMDVDAPWCDRHLSRESAAVVALITNLVQTKTSRLDDFSGYEVTCFIKDSEAARHVRSIPGYS